MDNINVTVKSKNPVVEPKNLKELTAEMAEVKGTIVDINASVEQAEQDVERLNEAYNNSDDFIIGPDNKMKRKPKAYAPAEYSGLGEIYLDKNMKFLGREFEEFVSNPNVPHPGESIGDPDGIVYDRVRQAFLGYRNIEGSRMYTDTWDEQTDYTAASGYKYLCTSTDTAYKWQNGDLVETAAINGNILTQAMLDFEHTIYHIQYDYDLNGRTIEVPLGCVLQFDGGSITDSSSNNTVVFNETELKGDIRCFCKIEGSIKNNPIYTKWFYYNQDLHGLINSLLADGKTIIVANGTYTVEQSLDISGFSNITVDYFNSIIIDNLPEEAAYVTSIKKEFTFYLLNCSDIEIKNINYRKGSNKFFADANYVFEIGNVGNIPLTEVQRNISIKNISAVCDFETDKICMFINIIGESYNVNIENINYDGKISCFLNAETGLASFQDTTLNYGRYPHNITVKNIVCKNCINSDYILRTSGAYNVIFDNCSAENVKGFISCFSSDESNDRTQGTVIFNNCNGQTDLSQVSFVTISTSAHNNPNTPSVQRDYNRDFDFSYIFNNCCFEQTTHYVGGNSGIRIYDLYSNVVFNGCKIKGFYRGFDLSFDNNYINSNIVSKLKNIEFNNTVFVENRFCSINNYTQLYLKGCSFINDELGVYSSNYESNIGKDPYIEFDNCLFQRDDVEDNPFRAGLSNPFITLEKRYFSKKLPKINGCTFVGNTSYAIANKSNVTVTNCVGNNLFYLDKEHYTSIPKDNVEESAIVLDSSFTSYYLNYLANRHYVIKNASVTIECLNFSAPNQEIMIYVVQGASLKLKLNVTDKGMPPIYGYKSSNGGGEYIDVPAGHIVKITSYPNNGEVIANFMFIGIVEVIDILNSDRKGSVILGSDYTSSYVNYQVGRHYLIKDTAITLDGIVFQRANQEVVFHVLKNGSLKLVPNQTVTGYSPFYSPQNNDIDVPAGSIVRVTSALDNGEFHVNNMYMGLIEVSTIK